MPWQFVGYHPFVHRAAAEHGLAGTTAVPEAVRLASLHRLGGLIGQLEHATPDARPGILEEATRSRNALALGLIASDMILTEARAAYFPEPEPAAEPEPTPEPQPEPEPEPAEPEPYTTTRAASRRKGR